MNPAPLDSAARFMGGMLLAPPDIDNTSVFQLDTFTAGILVLTPRIAQQAETGESPLAGLTFVVTGDLEQFANRKELQALIEKGGGKVTGSGTKKKNFLINNDIHSASSKNKKAAELGIPILSEQDFIDKFLK